MNHQSAELRMDLIDHFITVSPCSANTPFVQFSIYFDTTNRPSFTMCRVDQLILDQNCFVVDKTAVSTARLFVNTDGEETNGDAFSVDWASGTMTMTAFPKLPQTNEQYLQGVRFAIAVKSVTALRGKARIILENVDGIATTEEITLNESDFVVPETIFDSGQIQFIQNPIADNNTSPSSSSSSSDVIATFAIAAQFKCATAMTDCHIILASPEDGYFLRSRSAVSEDVTVTLTWALPDSTQTQSAEYPAKLDDEMSVHFEAPLEPQHTYQLTSGDIYVVQTHKRGSLIDSDTTHVNGEQSVAAASLFGSFSSHSKEGVFITPVDTSIN